MKKYIITIAVIVGLVLVAFGSYYIYSSNHTQNTSENLKAKVDEEITYLNTTIVSMMNQLNHISYANYKIVEEEIPTENENVQTSQQAKSGQSSESSGGASGEQGEPKSGSNTITNMNMDFSSVLVNTNKKIDWTTIKKETEKMYHTWPTVLIDLNALNVKQDDLLKYSTVLDNVTKAVQKEDKKNTLYQLSNLYSLLSAYTRQYSNDSKRIHILETKLNILYAYSLLEDSKWDEMKTYIKKAQSSYGNLMNSSLKNAQNMNVMNKVYVLLNEIEKSIDTKDKSIFYINYKNLMQEIEILEM